MAYVALSSVRRLSGLHLIAFDPRSVMVSLKSLCEVNRLRQLFTPHLSLYDVPVAGVGDRKHTLRGICTGFYLGFLVWGRRSGLKVMVGRDLRP